MRGRDGRLRGWFWEGLGRGYWIFGCSGKGMRLGDGWVN